MGGQARHPEGPMEAALQIVITPSGELTDRDRDIIAFERPWWKYAGAK